MFPTSLQNKFNRTVERRERRDLRLAEKRERGGRTKDTVELLFAVSLPLSWQCLGGSTALFNTRHLVFFFSFILSLSLNPQITLYFFDLHVQISWFGLVFGARFLLCLFHRNQWNLQMKQTLNLGLEITIYIR